MLKSILPNLSLVGETNGLWKNLPGYQKPSGLRTGPVSPPPRLGEAEIQRIGEALFAEIRPAMGYKRRDLEFSRDGLTGVLAAKDFELSVAMASGGEDASSFVIRKTLSRVRDEEVFRHEGFNQVFRSMFHRLEFRPPSAIAVEDWIDRVEERDLEEEWSLEYPPDCSRCRMSLPKTDFDIEVTPETLAIHRMDPAPPSLFLEQLDRLGVVWRLMETND